MYDVVYKVTSNLSLQSQVCCYEHLSTCIEVSVQLVSGVGVGSEVVKVPHPSRCCDSFAGVSSAQYYCFPQTPPWYQFPFLGHFLPGSLFSAACWPHSCSKPPSPLPSSALIPPFSNYFLNVYCMSGSEHISLLPFKGLIIVFSFEKCYSLRTQVVLYPEQGDWLREFIFTIFLGTLWLSIQLVRFNGERMLKW